MRSPCFLTLDVGTTCLKAGVVDLSGQLLAVARQEYQLLTPAPSWVELPVEVYWQTACQVARQALAHSGVTPEQVRAVCIASQGETLVPLDAHGKPLRHAIVWLDNRALAEAEALRASFDPQELYQRTGQPEVTPAWPASKLLWIRHHEPQVFARAARYLLLEDYLLYRLTGRFVTGMALQTSSLLLDIRQRTWWPAMLDRVGVRPEQLGELLEPGAVVGPLSPEGAQALGLTPHSLAVCGGMDQVVGALGAGNSVPGVVSETTGGALGIVVSLDRPRYDPDYGIPCHCHALPDGYCLLAWGQTAGMALRWFRDQFFALEAQVAAGAGLDPYDLMTAPAAQVPAGCDGLLVLPHLEGATCPEFNPAARAVFFGATLRHGRAHFTRAIMEAVAYMLKKNLERVERLGVTTREVRSMGGGARSPLWLQIKADVLQKPILTLEVEESALLGAALLCAVATGYYASLSEATQHMVRLRNTVLPNPQHQAVYAQGYARYLELYERLEPMFT